MSDASGKPHKSGDGKKPERVADVAKRSSVVRSQARLAAVQALYQMDLASTDLNKLINEFVTERFGANAEDDTVAMADQTLFESIVRGVVTHQLQIDPAVDAQLATGWRLNRLDATLRAVLRAAMYEILYRKDVPGRVVITEYLDIAKAFFEGEEPKVTNAVLDKLAKKHRPKEFGG
jgi:transcription antitermination protein NusB